MVGDPQTSEPCRECQQFPFNIIWWWAAGEIGYEFGPQDVFKHLQVRTNERGCTAEIRPFACQTVSIGGKGGVWLGDSNCGQ